MENMSGFPSRASRILFAALQNKNINGLERTVDTVPKGYQNESSGSSHKSTEGSYYNEEQNMPKKGTSFCMDSTSSADLWNTPIILSSQQQTTADEVVYNDTLTVSEPTVENYPKNCEHDISFSGLEDADIIGITNSNDNNILYNQCAIESDVETSIEINVLDIPNNENAIFLDYTGNTSNHTVSVLETSVECTDRNIENLENEDRDPDYMISDINSDTSDSDKQENLKTSNKKIRLVNYSDSESSEDSQKKVLQEEKPKRSRRKRHEVKTNDWTSNAQKANREKGRPYMGRKKEEKMWAYTVKKSQRVLQPRCDCRLMNKKSEINCGLVSDDDRQQIFTYFWNLSWKEKRIYSNMLIVMKPVCRTRDRKEENRSRRSNSFEFYLKINENKIRVCKEMFHRTLGIRPWSSLNWKKKQPQQVIQERTAEDEEQGASQGFTVRQQPFALRIKCLENFLSSLPSMESHYCRALSKRKYLEPIWKSKMELFKFYVNNWCKTKNEKPLSIAKFSQMFQERNLSLFRPKKDECDICMAYKVKNIEEAKYFLHQEKKEEAREEKEKDKTNEDNVFTMDMQSVLLSPKSNVSLMYYKMKLAIHNFTLYNLKTKDGTCYLWNETEGALTAQEISSILSDFLNKLIPTLTENKKVILYSDGCTYQNRNAILANALLNISVISNVVIEQKYLEKGHTQMEADSMHSCIERRLKNTIINVPADYVAVCLKARQNPHPYEVKYLDHLFFKNFDQIQFYSSIRPGRTTGDSVVTDLRALQYNPNGKIFFKLRFSDQWTELPSRKNKKISTVLFNDLPQLHKDRLKIKKRKFEDLQSLKQSLHSDYHTYYDNIPYQ